MRITHGIIITIFLIVAGTAVGEEPVADWTGTLGLAFSLTRGNSDTTNLSFNATAKNAFAPRWEWVNSAYLLNQESDGVKKADIASLTTGVNWAIMNRQTLYAEAGYLKDRFKDYQYRLTPGVGYGYGMIEAEHEKLNLLAGLTYVVTRYYSTGDSKSYMGVKAGDTYWMKISPTAEFTQGFEIVSDVAEPSRWFAKFDLGLSAALTQKLAMTFSLRDSYDAKPVDPELVKNDWMLMAGITFKY